MRPIIRVQNLSKEYAIGGAKEPYSTFRESLVRISRAPLKMLRRKKKTNIANRFWALRDVSFEVMPGEVIGVIGRNGAGKSTLLKVLSRITEPTKGRIELFGRIGSLLEVGTGFHPELTGRENIFLNGSILGMKRNEIIKNFDEIVAFAEVEQFLDTPVKRYSSGMYVRLAFAVAVHLEPEILIIDEVLAVGDAEFQKKCMNKMKEVGKSGRSILFVSHNMASIRSICTRGIVLENGKVVEIGGVNEAVDNYLSRHNRPAQEISLETNSFSVESIQINSKGESIIKTFDPVEIRVIFTPKQDIYDPGLYVGILTFENQRVAGIDFKDLTSIPSVRRGQKVEMGFDIESLPLLPGSYQLEVHLKDMKEHKVELVPQLHKFEVAETPIYGGRKLNEWNGVLGLTVEPRSREILDGKN